MSMTEVTFSLESKTSLVMAAGESRAIADDGGVALVRPTGRRRRDTPAAYVTRTETGYQVDAAGLWDPEWIGRLRRILNRAEENPGV